MPFIRLAIWVIIINFLPLFLIADINNFIPQNIFENEELEIISADELLSDPLTSEAYYIDYNIESFTNARLLYVKTFTRAHDFNTTLAKRFEKESLLSFSNIQIDGYTFSMASILDDNGRIKYALHIAIYEKEEKWILENHWQKTSTYDFQNFENFQLWAYDISSLNLVFSELLTKLKSQMPIEFSNSIAPSAFIQSVRKIGNQVEVDIQSQFSNMPVHLVNNLYHTETSIVEKTEKLINLNQGINTVSIPFNSIYLSELCLMENAVTEIDRIQITDGLWEIQDQDGASLVDYFQVKPIEKDVNIDDQAISIDRDVFLFATMKGRLVLSRSLNSDIENYNFQNYDQLKLRAEGEGSVTIKLKVKQDKIVRTYEYQTYLSTAEALYTIPMTNFISEESRLLEWSGIQKIEFHFGPDNGIQRILKVKIRDIEFAKSQIITQTEEISLNPALQVYPNPTSDYININIERTVFESKKSKIQLFDSNGRVVYAKNINGSQSRYQIGIVELNIPSGTYFLQINNVIGQSYSQAVQIL